LVDIDPRAAKPVQNHLASLQLRLGSRQAANAFPSAPMNQSQEENGLKHASIFGKEYTMFNEFHQATKANPTLAMAMTAQALQQKDIQRTQSDKMLAAALEEQRVLAAEEREKASKEAAAERERSSIALALQTTRLQEQSKQELAMAYKFQEFFMNSKQDQSVPAKPAPLPVSEPDMPEPARTHQEQPVPTEPKNLHLHLFFSNAPKMVAKGLSSLKAALGNEKDQEMDDIYEFMTDLENPMPHELIKEMIMVRPCNFSTVALVPLCMPFNTSCTCLAALLSCI
jgi:hypothetical protein